MAPSPAKTNLAGTGGVGQFCTTVAVGGTCARRRGCVAEWRSGGLSVEKACKNRLFSSRTESAKVGGLGRGAPDSDAPQADKMASVAESHVGLWVPGDGGERTQDPPGEDSADSNALLPPHTSTRGTTMTPLTVTHLLEHLFCPRFTYFEYVLGVPERQGSGRWSSRADRSTRNAGAPTPTTCARSSASSLASSMCRWPRPRWACAAAWTRC